MKKTIGLLLITISLNCFGQTNETRIHNIDSTVIGTIGKAKLSKADSVQIMSTQSLAINDLLVFDRYIQGIQGKWSVTDYNEIIMPILGELYNMMWQKAEAIRKQKPK